MWGIHADTAQKQLMERFWNEDISCFNHAYPLAPETNEKLVYWWFAHAIDVLLDGYARTGDDNYRKYADDTLEGVMKLNGNTVLHNWYDDMEWFGLALLRFYDLTGNEKYKNLTYILWDDIKTAWNPHMGGGLAWRKDQLDYKNTPANAPAAILGARLFQRFHIDSDYQWAEKIYNWNKDNLQDPESGFVWDGVNRLGDGEIDKDWDYTYCQGVMIGAAIELYRCKEDDTLLDNAKRILHATQNRLLTQDGICKDEGDGDAALFKGILARYLVVLSEQCPETRDIVRQLLIANGNSLLTYANQDGSYLFGTSWEEPATGVVSLSGDLSGIMLLEALCKLESGNA